MPMAPAPAGLVPSKRSFSEVCALPSYHECLPMAAELLTNLAKKNTPGTTPFDGVDPPTLSPKDYLIRICKYGFCTPDVWIWMVIFLDRLNSESGVEVTVLNVHRLIITSFVVAAKLRDDTFYSNGYYASVGGLTTAELNAYERTFLELSQWKLWIDEEEYELYVTSMRRRLAQRRAQVTKQWVQQQQAIQDAGSAPAPPAAAAAAAAASAHSAQVSACAAVPSPKPPPPRASSSRVGSAGHLRESVKLTSHRPMPNEVMPDIDDGRARGGADYIGGPMPPGELRPQPAPRGGLGALP